MAFFTAILIFLLLLPSSITVSASQNQLRSDSPPDFRLKKTPPVFFNTQRHNIKKEKPNFYRNKLTVKKLDSRQFSAMLSKGFVPPSGSPCYNVYPNSVAFFCDLSTLSLSQLSLSPPSEEGARIHANFLEEELTRLRYILSEEDIVAFLPSKSHGLFSSIPFVF